jgi:lambda family phage tail tape measure protein
MSVIGTLSVKIVGDKKELDKSLKQSQESVKKYGAAVAAAMVASAAAIGYMVKSSINSMDKLSKQSQMVGITTESLSGLAYAAELAGVKQDELVGSLSRLSKGMSDAKQGTGEALKAFEALNLNPAQFSGTDDALLQIAERFSGLQDGAEKTALAISLFGRSGAQLIPFLNAGKAGMEELTKEARRLGVVVGTDAARASEQFNDNLTRLKKTVDGLAIGITSRMLPTLNNLLQLVVDISAEAQNSNWNRFMPERSFFASDELPTLLENVQKFRKEVEVVSQRVEEGKQMKWGLDVMIANLEQAEIKVQNLARVLHRVRGLSSLGEEYGDQVTPLLTKPNAPGMGGKDPQAEKLRNMLEAVKKLSDEFNRSQEYQLSMMKSQDAMLGMTRDQASVQETINSVLDATNSQLERIANQKLEAVNAGANAAILKQYDDESQAIKELGDAWAELAKIQKQSSIEAQRTFSFGWNTALAQFAEDASNSATIAKDMFTSLTSNLSNAIANFVETGKLSFKSLAASIIKDLIRIQLQAQVSKVFGLIASGIGSAISASFSPAASLGNEFGDRVTYANGGFTGVGGKYEPAGIVHKGEYVLNAAATKRMGVGRLNAINGGGYANGGLVGGGSAMGGNVTINIKNEAGGDGYQATAQARRNETGLDIDVMVKRVIANDLRNNGGLAQQMASTFNLRRTA